MSEKNSEIINKYYNDIKLKTSLLLFISFLTAFSYWKIINLNLVGNEIQHGVGLPILICPLLFWAVYLINDKINHYAWLSGILMAISIGIFFGAISGFFEKGANGLIIQTVLTTFGSVISNIYLYDKKFIIVNNKFLRFTSYVLSTLIITSSIDLILSFVNLEWHSFYSGVSILAIILNAIIILLAYLIFTLDLDIINKKINTLSITNNQSWKFSIELLIDTVWTYFAILFLILRLRGRGKR